MKKNYKIIKNHFRVEILYTILPDHIEQLESNNSIK